MLSAYLNRSISTLEQMDLGRAELFISETRMALSLQVIIGLCKHKEAAALKIEPPLQNGRADMSAIRRLFLLPSSGRSFHIYETWCLANTRREIPAPTPKKSSAAGIAHIAYSIPLLICSTDRSEIAST